jgi:NAD(P)-dependent dehydrogenase (short-subunit alcohol dehydrogenase family)
VRGRGGKVAVLTGGAGGIGSAISWRLAAEGCRGVITRHRPRRRAQAYITGQTLSVSGLTMA